MLLISTLYFIYGCDKWKKDNKGITYSVPHDKLYFFIISNNYFSKHILNEYLLVLADFAG